MHPTRDGLLLPNIHEPDCIHCGLCLAVCPGREVPFPDLANAAGLGATCDPLLGPLLRCYTGHATDPAVRQGATSGGIVSALLIHGLADGLIRRAVAARMHPERPLETQSCMVTDAASVMACAGSKYVPVALDAVGAAVRGAKPFAVVGLPCHVHALRKWAATRPELGQRMLLIGLMCGFGKTFRVLDSALRKTGLTAEAVRNVTFRAGGWPGCMHIECQDGTVRQIPFRDWFARDLSPLRCTLCVDGAAELADISCGDAWLPEFKGTESGVSVVVARTERGLQWIESAHAAGVLTLDEVPSDTVIRSQDRMLRRKKNQFSAHAVWTRLAGGVVPRYGIALPVPSVRTLFLAGITRIRMAASRTPASAAILWFRRAGRHLAARIGGRQ